MTFEYVDFPALGLRVPVSRTLFKVFGHDIYTYAVIIALSIVLMIFLGLRHAERYGIGQNFIIDFMIFAMPASIICARLYYVIFSWDSYRGNLIDIINIRQGGMAIYGAVIGAFLTVVIFSRVRKVDALRFLDFGVPYLLLAQGIGRWGNFVNQEVFGANTSLPWGMTSDQIAGYLASHQQWLTSLGVAVDPLKPVHPTFLYESLWNVLVACFLFWLRRRMKFKGEVLFGYLIGYGAGRAFIEGLRTDSLMLGSFRISQLLSVLIVAACLAAVLFFRGKFPKYSDDPLPEAGAAGGGDGGESGDGGDGDSGDTGGAGDTGGTSAEVDGPGTEPDASGSSYDFDFMVSAASSGPGAGPDDSAASSGPDAGPDDSAASSGPDAGLGASGSSDGGQNA